MQCPKVCNGYFYRCWFAWSSCPFLDPSPGGNDLPALSEAQEPPKHNQGIASNDPTAESPDVAQGDPGPRDSEAGSAGRSCTESK